MNATIRNFLAVTFAACALGACGEEATLKEQAGTGPKPELPKPNQTFIPTINIAPAKGWPQGNGPVAAAGFTVANFASGLDHPR